MHVIILSADPNVLVTCLESIEERDVAFLSRTTVVVDDPELFAGVQARFPEIALFAAEPPFNFAQRNNAVITSLPEVASFMLLNDDTRLLTANGFTLLESILEQGDGIDLLSAAIRGVSGVIEQRQVTPSSIRLLKGHIAFTAIGIARRAFDTLGLLDERFIGYGYEDTDFCERAVREGMTIGVCDGCVVEHKTPHTTFSRDSRFSDMWLLGQTLFWEKWREPQETAVVIGGSRSGAAVYTAVLQAMGYEMPDPPAPFEKNVSAYYRDEQLSRIVKRGDLGARNYIAGRDMSGKAWGTRIWPAAEMAIRFLSAFENQPRLLFVTRNREARIHSYVHVHGLKYADAELRIDSEIEEQQKILEWAHENISPDRYDVYSFEELIEEPDRVLEDIAYFIGYEKSLSVARDVVRPEFAVYRRGVEIYTHTAPQDFGRVAVGVRLTHPEASFVGCYARLLRNGLREDDVVMEPVIRTPAHWAASTLMKRFLASGCDTLLLLDDDMTFPYDLLESMRSHQDNWRYHIVSALATQRVPPPRAIVLRKDEQPPLPDSRHGLYYSLLVDEIVDGETLPVDGAGFAFTLIRREVIERMTDPEWGPNYTSYVMWGEGGEGEDVNFCRRAGSLGFRVAVDAGCHVGHVGTVVYGYDEFNQWRNTHNPTGLLVDDLIGLVESALPSLRGQQLETAVTLLKKARE